MKYIHILKSIYSIKIWNNIIIENKNNRKIKHICKEVRKMKFVKGAIIGSAIAAGVLMAYSDNVSSGKKKMMKTGKRLMRKMGITVL